MLSNIKITKWLAGCISIGMFSMNAWSDDFEKILEEMDVVKVNQVEYQIALEEGKDRSMICGYCHGKDGNSIKPDAPNLAGQDSDYLLKQLHLYSIGERKNYVMEQLTRGLKNEEKINMALYFSAQKVRPQGDVITSAKGKAVYERSCASCHGVGRGNNKHPRIAGQNKDFLITTLNALKQGKTSRASSQMLDAMKEIDEADIVPLSNYIATMP